MGETAVTIGGMIAGIVQFVIMLTLLGPAIQYSTPVAFRQNFTATYFPNGTINDTGLVYKVNATFTENLSSPLTKEVNHSTTSYQSAGYLQQFGGLAFVPLGLGSMFNTIKQAPAIIKLIFDTSFTNPILAKIAGLVLISSLIFGYILILLALKMIGWITKVNVEEM